MMKIGQKLLITFILIAIAGLNPIAFAGENKDNWIKNCVWFDSKGVFHCGDIAEYLQKVKAGKIKDPEIEQAMKSLKIKGDKIKAKTIVAIASKLDPLNNTAAIYPQDENYLKKHKKLVVDHFSKESTSPGILTIQSYAVRKQGAAGLIPGSTSTNMFMAIPADPELLAGASLEKDMEGSPVLEQKLKAAVDDDEWTTRIVQLMPSELGKTNLPHLYPGPWIVYQNQYGIMAFCYRVQVKQGVNKKLVADQLLWQAQLGG